MIPRHAVTSGEPSSTLLDASLLCSRVWDSTSESGCLDGGRDRLCEISDGAASVGQTCMYALRNEVDLSRESSQETFHP